MPLKEQQIQNLSITIDCITAIQLFQKVKRLNGPSSANLFASLFSHAVRTAHNFFLEHIQSKATGGFKELKERFKYDIFEKEQSRSIFTLNEKLQNVLSINKDAKKKIGKKIFEIEKKIFSACDELNIEIGIVEKVKKRMRRTSFSIFGKFVKIAEERKKPVDLYLEELRQLEKEGGVIHAKRFRKKTGTIFEKIYLNKF